MNREIRGKAVLFGLAFLMFGLANARCVYIFYNPTCPHCDEELSFLYNISGRYNLTINEYDVLNSNVTPLFTNLSQYYSSGGDVPLTFIGNSAFVGFTYGNSSVNVNSRLKLGYSGALLAAIQNSSNACPSLPIPYSCPINSTSCATKVTPQQAQRLAADSGVWAIASVVIVVILALAFVFLALRLRSRRKQ